MTSKKEAEASSSARTSELELASRLSVARLPVDLVSDSARAALYARQWRSGKGIADPAQQQQVIAGLCALQAAGTAYEPLTHERLGPVQVREDGTLLLAASIGRRRLLLQLGGYYASYSMYWEPESGFNLSSLQMFADRVQKRCGVSARVKFRFRPAVDSEVPVEGTVVDVSTGGLAFTVEQGAQLPWQGHVLRGCAISWKGGAALKIDADVVQVSYHGPLARVGVRLIAPTNEWQELVEELQYPESVRGNVDPDQVWSAYIASGYLNISGRESRNFDEERPAFRKAQELLARAPDVGAIFSGGRRNEPEAYIHHVQAWPGSWINIHLCRLSKGRTLRTSDDGILLRLYEHCYGFAIAQPQTRWFVTYTHSEDTAYSHRLHCEFAQTLDETAGCVVPVEPTEIWGAKELAADEVGIGEPTAVELQMLRRTLERQLSLTYLKAMALAEDDLGLARMSQAWVGSGLERGRGVLVARRDGRMVAAAVLDFASRGMHVYGLLDQARLIEVDPVGRADFDRLLAAAHRRYAERGHRKFVYFRELHAPAVCQALAPASLGKAHINVVSREQFGSFLEHVFLLHSRTLNPNRGDATSYSAVLPRLSMALSLSGKTRVDGVGETLA